MSEEAKAAPEAVVNEPSEGQKTQGQTASEAKTVGEANEDLADSWPDANPEKPEEAAADDDEEGEKDEDERPRKKSRSERLRRQNERLQVEIATLKSVSAPAAVQDQAGLDAVVAQRVGEPPKEDDFKGDWFAYERAMTAYEADRRTVTRQVKEYAQQAQAAERERIRDLADDYQEHLQSAAKAIPDLMDVLGKSTYRPTPLIERLLLEAGDKAPLVVYNLAQNPKTAARLNAMSPIEAAREIGRIEGRVSLPRNTATRASPPVTPVKGAASPSRGLGKSMSDYERWRNS